MSSPGFIARVKLVNSAHSVVKDTDALRIGILGAANIAPPALIGPAKHLRSIIVVSVAARDPVKAKAYAEKNGIPNTHASYDALIADPEIDCIYNPLPNGLHYEWTRKALEAGKHVLLEKPATSNEAQAKELISLAQSKNLVLLEAFHYRFHPASLKFRELVQTHVTSGHPIQKIQSVMAFPMIFGKDDIRFNFKLAGGITMDAGCYTINSIRYFSGLEVESVEAAKPKIVSENVDGRMEATLRLKGGAEAKLIASLTNPWLSVQTYREILPTITVETDDKIFTFGVFLLPGVYHYITVKDKATGKTENLPKQYGGGFSTYYYQLEAFVKAVKSGNNKDVVNAIPGWVPGEDTVANMKVIDAVYKQAGMSLRE
ncbi:NAD(P)-binding protein [Linnemannia elongata]|nr:NAD(P)-binding protein [Linnemannia elongata]